MSTYLRDSAATCPAAEVIPGGVRFVPDFAALISTPFSADINALCWRRRLPGDFAEIVAGLGDRSDPVFTLDADLLRGLDLSRAGRVAADTMLADFTLLCHHGLDPALNCVYGYPPDERGGPITTDVFSFHVDSAPCPTDTWLCTYHGPASEGLWHADARRLIDTPSTRTALRTFHNRADDADFTEFLREQAYDLHYAALPPARPFTFGMGNLWRIATEHPGGVAPPCIHRAPTPAPGDPPRLLLIS
jgi:hypothetical protein